MKVISGIRSGAAIVIAVLCRPSLWSTALIQVFRLTPRRWWARFRVLTQYGERDHTLEVADVLSYLRWLKDSQ
jgi:hypothetical protein